MPAELLLEQDIVLFIMLLLEDDCISTPNPLVPVEVNELFKTILLFEEDKKIGGAAELVVFIIFPLIVLLFDAVSKLIPKPYSPVPEPVAVILLLLIIPNKEVVKETADEPVVLVVMLFPITLV